MDLESRQAPDPEDDESGPFVLTDRDISLFKLTHEHRYIVYSQIRQGFWKGRSCSAKACYKRVERLVSLGYLARGYSGRKKLNVYFITTSSLAVLKTYGLDSGIACYEPTPWFDRHIDHDLKVLNVRILLRHLGLDSWTSERVIRERDHPRKVMDGILNLGGKKAAIEFENRLEKPVADYEAMMNYYRGHEDYPLLFLIIDGYAKDWLVRFLSYDVRQVWMTTYWDLLKRKDQAVFENKASKFFLHAIL